MQKRWFIKDNINTNLIEELTSTFKVSSFIARLLAQRKLTTEPEIRSFFYSSTDQLHDPFLMHHMREAVLLLDETIKAKKRILIYGDYDVDGTTAVALVYKLLSRYADVSYYIPDRYEEGYGLSFKGVQYALDNGFDLLITLDCGIKELEKIAFARANNLEVIVCDHHTPGPVLPDCIVLDPKKSMCNYPFKDLCGCGVGFKMLHAWLMHRNESTDFLFSNLDFVAVAIGADIVSVTGENRILCKEGLRILNENKRIGFRFLVEQAKRSFPLDLSAVVFSIAPRINAAGRLKSGARAVELLLSENEEIAKAIALEIEDYNTERRSLDASITQQALEQIAEISDYDQRASTVVYRDDWNKGVVGIVASRLIEKHYRPTIVLTKSNGHAVGSARSIPGFSIYNALEACSENLTQFGGHDFAAGLTLPVDQVDNFYNAFDSYVQKTLKKEHFVEELQIDAEISFADLFVQGESVQALPRSFEFISKMEPFGPANDKPVFCIKNVYATNQKLLKELHLKFDIIDTSSNIQLPAIGFNMQEYESLIASGCSFDCAFTLEKNVWNNRATLQLQVRDIRPSF